MTIKRIDDYSMLYETEELCNLMMQCFQNATYGKVQSAAQSIYAKTQGVIYVAYDSESGEALALLGGSRIDSHRFIIKHFAKSQSTTDIQIFRSLLDQIIDDYRFSDIEAECIEQEKDIFTIMGFKLTPIKNHPLDLIAYDCLRKVQYNQ